jgi:hypothetical protein
MAHVDPVALRFELLRTRAAIERAELRAAVLELRSSTASLRTVIGFFSGHAPKGEGRREGIGSLVLTIVGLLRERPWLLSALATVATRRGLRRWLVLGAVAALVTVLVRRVVAPPAPRGDATA